MPDHPKSQSLDIKLLNPVRVFITYSHDSQPHIERVLSFTDRLVADGIDAEIDQYNIAPPEGWPLWCEQQIEIAEFVLMVCTESYHRRVSGDEERGKGLGAVWEAGIIRQLLYDAGAVSNKFVPVLFSDGRVEHIPTLVRGRTRYVVDTEDGYDGLYRHLTNQPRRIKPPLGSLLSRPPEPSQIKKDDHKTASTLLKTQRDIQWSNLAKLLNREPQETALLKHLERMRKTGRTIDPLLVLLPGCSRDCHEHFIHRVGWQDLQPFFNTTRPDIIELLWRPRANMDLLLTDIRAMTGLHHSDAPSIQRSVYFFYRIDEESWREDGGKLLREWVDFFCASWPPPPVGHLVICFLCIVLPETPTGLMALFRPRNSGSLKSFVSELRLRDEPRLLVTPDMRKIRHRDLMTWVSRIRGYVSDTERAEDIWEACKDILPGPASQLPFEDIYPRLRHVLQTILGPAGPAVTR